MKAKIEIYNYVAAFLLLLSAWLFVCLQPVYGAEDTINGRILISKTVQKHR